MPGMSHAKLAKIEPVTWAEDWRHLYSTVSANIGSQIHVIMAFVSTVLLSHFGPIQRQHINECIGCGPAELFLKMKSKSFIYILLVSDFVLLFFNYLKI